MTTTTTTTETTTATRELDQFGLSVSRIFLAFRYPDNGRPTLPTAEQVRSELECHGIPCSVEGGDAANVIHVRPTRREERRARYVCELYQGAQELATGELGSTPEAETETERRMAIAAGVRLTGPDCDDQEEVEEHGGHLVAAGEELDLAAVVELGRSFVAAVGSSRAVDLPGAGELLEFLELLELAAREAE